MLLSDQQIRELCTGEYKTQLDCLRKNKRVDPPTSVVPDYSEIEILSPNGKPMIEPFIDHSVRYNSAGEKVTSYGLSSYGYDVRIANEFKLFNRPNDGRIIDVKNFNEDNICETIVADHVIIPPGGLLLARTVEYFRIPRSVLVTCLGKSTIARIGGIVHPTPLEPEWEGELVIEVTNGSGLPLKIYANEGIAQLIFHVGDQPCTISYADRGGKYQGQRSVTMSRM